MLDQLYVPPQFRDLHEKNLMQRIYGLLSGLPPDLQTEALAHYIKLLETLRFFEEDFRYHLKAICYFLTRIGYYNPELPDEALCQLSKVFEAPPALYD